MTRIRVITRADYGPLAALMSAYPWEGITAWPWEARLAHWWDENPAFDPTWDRGWLVEHEGGPVGLLGSVPRRVLLDQKPALSANATTWWVHPDHRASSLQLLARWAAQSAAAHFNSTGSSNTIKVMEAFRFAGYPGEDWKQESFLVVDAGRIAAARIPGKLSAWPADLATWLVRGARLVGPIVDQAIDLRLRLARSAAMYEAQLLKRADDRFDTLSVEVGRRWRLTASRDRASLDWYLQGEAADRKVLLACSRGAQLAGYALMLERVSGSSNDLPVLECVDIAYHRDDPAVIACLVREAAAVARQRRVAIVVWRHFDAFLGRAFATLGLIRRAGPPRREHARLAPGLGAHDCYITQFHGDLLI